MQMKLTYSLALVAVCLANLTCRASATDRIKLAAGGQSAGEITAISPAELEIKLGQTKRKFAVNEIDSVTFDAEPNDLNQARIAVHAGRFDDALAQLEKIDAKKIERAEIQQDVEYYKALAAVRLALAGNGSKADAGRALLAFEKKHKNSFHYYEACEALGELLAALGKFDQAESYFTKLAAAPWPDYKMRAGALAGRALVGLKEYDRALARFEDVLAMEATTKDGERQKLAASLGKAAALAGSGKSDQAIALVNDIIAKADPDNVELHARAYNILGGCYKAADKKNDALLAYLHVDLLYSRFPDLHAEALANLATLWAQVDKTDRATQARATLKEKYPNSIWAQQ
jgi:tetratricopeptide (TPR) repeat protein